MTNIEVYQVMSEYSQTTLTDYEVYIYKNSKDSRDPAAQLNITKPRVKILLKD